MEILDGIKNFVYFWKLNKAIYGLKQTFRMWNNKINNIILKLNIIRSKKKKKKKMNHMFTIKRIIKIIFHVYYHYTLMI